LLQTCKITSHPASANRNKVLGTFNFITIIINKLVSKYNISFRQLLNK